MSMRAHGVSVRSGRADPRWRSIETGGAAVWVRVHASPLQGVITKHAAQRRPVRHVPAASTAATAMHEAALKTRTSSSTLGAAAVRAARAVHSALVHNHDLV
jgi:hypothetical protein